MSILSVFEMPSLSRYRIFLATAAILVGISGIARYFAGEDDYTLLRMTMVALMGLSALVGHRFAWVRANPHCAYYLASLLLLLHLAALVYSGDLSGGMILAAYLLLALAGGIMDSQRWLVAQVATWMATFIVTAFLVPAPETSPIIFTTISLALGVFIVLAVGAFNQARRTLQATREELATSQAFAGVGAWKIHTQSGLREWSDSAHDILEVSREDGTEPPPAAQFLLVPESESPTMQAVRRLLKQGEPFDVVEQMCTARGRKVWIHSRAQMMPGGVAVGVFTDVTDSMERQQALEQARQQAQSAAEARTQFLANMSHEMRTPLNGIIGTTSLLAEAGLGSQHQALIQVIQNCGDNMLTLVEDVLDFARLDGGTLDIKPHPFRLSELIDASLTRAQAAAGAKELSLIYATPVPTSLHLVGDQARLQQILDKLLDNAVKFTDMGGIELEVKVDARTDTDARLEVSIHDTGVGISQAMQDALFDAFTQADVSDTREHGGTGLGLAIAWQLAACMGGSLTVRSTPGEGSTFTLNVPCGIWRETTVGEPAVANAASPAGEDAAQKPDNKLSVLLVEDNLMNQQVAAKMLAKLGGNVDIASNGREAVDAVSGRAYDVVFMDVQMPVMDGIEATYAIRQLEQLVQPVIIGLSANVLPEDQARCLRAGMDAFLGKPARLKQLEEALVSVQNGEARGSGSGQVPTP